MTRAAFLLPDGKAGRRSPLLLLAAALMALAVFFVHDYTPASADHARITPWSATLTVAEVLATLNNGCSNGTGASVACSSASVLTDDDFTYGGVDYEIVSVVYDIPTSGATFTLNKTIPASMKANATLNANNIVLNFADATQSIVSVNNDSVSWSNIGGTAWSVGDTVQLSLSAPGTPDYGVDLTTESMTVNEGEAGAFSVDLSSDPGAETTVTLVRAAYHADLNEDDGAADHRWNRNAGLPLLRDVDLYSGRLGQLGLGPASDGDPHVGRRQL